MSDRSPLVINAEFSHGLSPASRQPVSISHHWSVRLAVMKVPELCFADAGGTRIAWMQFGVGPDVLAIPPLISNMELVWENEYYRRFLEHIAGNVRLTVFDKRGIGLSDKFYEMPSLEQRCDDIIAVMDAAGLARAAVLGQSEGGLMAQFFGAMHPDRVERLVLVNSHPGAACMEQLYTDADGTTKRLEDRRHRFDSLVATWGHDPQYFVDWMAPSRTNDASFVRWMGRYQRQSATAADLRRQLDSIRVLDASELLAGIDVPTLVVNVAGDPVIPVAAGRWLADRIRDAKFVEVPGEDHLVEVTANWREITDFWLEFITDVPPLPVAVDHSPEEELIGSSSGVESRRPDRPCSSGTRHATEVYTFGGFAVERDGATTTLATWGSRRARLLCRRLAAAAGDPVTRDELFELLWPDDLHFERLAARLSVQLSLVRRVLGGGIIADRDSVRLDLEVVSLDLARLRQAVIDRNWEEVVTIHCGEFLPEDAYEFWAQAPRTCPHGLRERTWHPCGGRHRPRRPR